MTASFAVSCGPVVTYFDGKSSQTQSFQPHGAKNVTDLTWSHNGAVLASCSSSHSENTIVLTSVTSSSPPECFCHDEGLIRPQEPTVKPIVKSLCFGGRSRYLLCGDSSGAVCLRDLKKKARVRHYFHDDASLQVRMNDTCVFSLSSRALHVFDLRHSSLLETIQAREECLYTKFTLTKDSSVVGIGRTDGKVDLVDLNQTESLRTIETPHDSSLTGLVFSATNQKLLASTSKDGIISFIDVDKQQVIQSIDVGECIQCLSFNSDGVSCAVGTDNGNISVLDLRKPKDATVVLKVDGPVTSIEYSPTKSLPTSARVATSRSNNAVNTSLDDLHGGISWLSIGQTATKRTSPKSVVEKIFVEEIVNEATDVLRDEMEEAIRNLHLDMLQHFQEQSNEFRSLMSEHMQAIDQLMLENKRLREENKFLRQGGGNAGSTARGLPNTNW